jgi:hypothetical protein
MDNPRATANCQLPTAIVRDQQATGIGGTSCRTLQQFPEHEPMGDNDKTGFDGVSRVLPGDTC